MVIWDRDDQTSEEVQTCITGAGFFDGKRIRARQKLVSVDEVQPNVIQQVSEITVEIEGEAKPAMVAESISRAYLEPQG